VFAIEVPSNEAGTDHPGNANDEPTGLETFGKDTYFQSNCRLQREVRFNGV